MAEILDIIETHYRNTFIKSGDEEFSGYNVISMISVYILRKRSNNAPLSPLHSEDETEKVSKRNWT